MSPLSPGGPPSLERTIQLSSALQLSGKAHEDYVHIVCRALMPTCETHPCGKLWVL